KLVLTPSNRGGIWERSAKPMIVARWRGRYRKRTVGGGGHDASDPFSARPIAPFGEPFRRGPHRSRVHRCCPNLVSLYGQRSAHDRDRYRLAGEIAAKLLRKRRYRCLH